MGHHAQYKKRCTTSGGSVYPDTPPHPEEWQLRWNASNIQVEYTVDPPADATGIQTQFALAGSGWTAGLSGSIKNAWFAIEAGSPSGIYYVQVRWAHVAGPAQPTSDWSLAKTVTIP